MTINDIINNIIEDVLTVIGSIFDFRQDAQAQRNKVQKAVQQSTNPKSEFQKRKEQLEQNSIVDNKWIADKPTAGDTVTQSDTIGSGSYDSGSFDKTVGVTASRQSDGGTHLDFKNEGTETRFSTDTSDPVEAIKEFEETQAVTEAVDKATYNPVGFASKWSK